MSEMSSLSHEYVSSSEFSRSLNAAVLLVKKHFTRGQPRTEDAELRGALERLRGTLSALIQRLDESAEGQADASIPEDVFERIVEDHRGSVPHFEQDLRHVLEVLERGEAIQRSELEFLDALCGAADASASATFRKLWRR
jgi:hypothetical protein